MLTLFKNFEKFLDSFTFEFQLDSVKPETMFKDIKYEKTEETGSDDNSTWKSEKWSSDAGHITYYKKVTTYKPKEEKKTEPTIEELKNKMNLLVKEQKYEEAILIRDKIKEMQKES